VPRVMALIRTAKHHQVAPPHFGHANAPATDPNGIRKWWGS
jgi:hypothetical protein